MVRPVFALAQGLKLSLFDSAVRRLAIWPWLVGFVSYFGSMYAAYRLHHAILTYFVAAPEGVWGTAKYGLVWLLVTAVLLLVSFFLSISLVMAFTSVFQSAIAQAALVSSGAAAKFPETTILGEAARTVAVELKKLLWLVPIGIVLFVAGFIPILTPFVLILGAWLLAYRFVDVVLDVFHVSSSRRFAFARRNFFPLTAFGLTLVAAWAVPFLGIFLAPAATAGAAWLLAEDKLLKQIESLAAEK